MRADSPIGRGIRLKAVWNGVPALYLGVPTNAVIWKVESYPNLQAVWTAQIGLRAMDNGKTETMSRRQVTLFFTIGKMMEKQTMWELWRNVKMG